MSTVSPEVQRLVEAYKQLKAEYPTLYPDPQPHRWMRGHFEIGDVVADKFQVEWAFVPGDHAEKYIVSDPRVGGRYYEARVYSLRSLSSKLYKYRVRNMKRYKGKDTFIGSWKSGALDVVVNCLPQFQVRHTKIDQNSTTAPLFSSRHENTSSEDKGPLGTRTVDLKTTGVLSLTNLRSANEQTGTSPALLSDTGERYCNNNSPKPKRTHLISSQHCDEDDDHPIGFPWVFRLTPQSQDDCPVHRFKQTCKLLIKSGGAHWGIFTASATLHSSSHGQLTGYWLTFDTGTTATYPVYVAPSNNLKLPSDGWMIFDRDGFLQPIPLFRRHWVKAALWVLRHTGFSKSEMETMLQLVDGRIGGR